MDPIQNPSGVEKHIDLSKLIAVDEKYQTKDSGGLFSFYYVLTFDNNEEMNSPL